MCAGPASLLTERKTTYGRANCAVRAAGAVSVFALRRSPR